MGGGTADGTPAIASSRTVSTLMSELYPSKEALDAAGTGAADAMHETFAQLDGALLSDHDFRDLLLCALAQVDEALVRRLHKQ